MGGGKRRNNVERVGRCCEESKGEHISTRLNKQENLELNGWKCEGERYDEVKEAFYTIWLLAAEFWQR